MEAERLPSCSPAAAGSSHACEFFPSSVHQLLFIYIPSAAHESSRNWANLCLSNWKWAVEEVVCSWGEAERRSDHTELQLPVWLFGFPHLRLKFRWGLQGRIPQTVSVETGSAVLLSSCWAAACVFGQMCSVFWTAVPSQPVGLYTTSSLVHFVGGCLETPVVLWLLNDLKASLASMTTQTNTNHAPHCFLFPSCFSILNFPVSSTSLTAFILSLQFFL